MQKGQGDSGPTCWAPRPDFPVPLRIGALVLPSRYVLAPLAGYTDLSFRCLVRALGGVGLATTDLVNARGLVAGSRKSLELIETCAADRPLSVQIFGNDIGALVAAAQLLQERSVDVVDINMGCPVEKVARNGAGAALLCHPARAVDWVRRIVESVRLPVTVKMRLGWDERSITAPDLAREFEQVGVAAVTVHGRTRQQAFRGSVRRDGIRAVVEAVHSLPVIGNGDVRTVADAARMLRETGCTGIAIGRGALANPWIFSQLVQWKQTGRFDRPGGFEERLQLLWKQFHFLEQLRGTERAIITFRKIGHWHLKAMGVRASLRNRFQQARTREEFVAALETIVQERSQDVDRRGAIASGFTIPLPT
ncbi:MAG TPA: tRNA dihydrouridine synthase DusB, partial [Planctomycetaceae bacterium]|nr:tRNA dihydrouridine synthase DusB [Planctomycetaceae bacterium]